jgi:hypothetical protein
VGSCCVVCSSSADSVHFDPIQVDASDLRSALIITSGLNYRKLSGYLFEVHLHRL